MPFRIDPYRFPNRAKVQFTTSAGMPNLIYKACLATGTLSNTVYIQHALAHALARDLNMDVGQILADLPTPRGPSAHLYDPDEHTMNRYHDIAHDQSGGRTMVGPGNTVEEVR